MTTPPRLPIDRRSDERLLRHVSGHGLSSWGLSTILVLGLGLAVGLLSYTGLAAVEMFPEPATLVRLTIGLAVLLVVFALYAFVQQRRFALLARRLITERDRATALDSRLSEITALFDVSARLHLRLDIEPMLETITSRLLPCLEADEASIMLLDEAGRELRCLAVSGADVELVREASVRMGEGIAGRVAESREATVILATDIGERFPGQEKRWRGLGSALCVPMLVDDEVVGVLNVSRLAHRHAFTLEDARLLAPFAGHLAITVRRIGEFEALDRRASAFERMHALRREFLCALNHELRNPLASIVGYADLLRSSSERLGPVERASFTGSMTDQATRMLESVDDLHRLYSLEASAITFETATGSLDQMVDDALTTLGARFERSGVRLDRWRDPGLPPVAMDLAKMHTAVRHLVGAALRGAGRGSALSVVTRAEAAGTPQARVTLVIEARHEGAGALYVAPEAAGGEGAHTDATRWGLVLIRELVELHGGTVRREDTPTGFRFELSLPTGEAGARARAA